MTKKKSNKKMNKWVRIVLWVLAAWVILYFGYWITSLMFWKEVKVEGLVSMKIPYSWFYDKGDEVLIISNCRYWDAWNVGCRKEKVSIVVNFEPGVLDDVIIRHDLNWFKRHKAEIWRFPATMISYKNEVFSGQVYFIEKGNGYVLLRSDIYNQNINYFERKIVGMIVDKVVYSAIFMK